jgi:hypothetical protein
MQLWVDEKLRGQLQRQSKHSGLEVTNPMTITIRTLFHPIPNVALFSKHSSVVKFLVERRLVVES